MERRHHLRGRLPGGGLHPERTITELTDADKSAEVARWSRQVTTIERKIDRAKRDSAPSMTLAGLYAEASHACMMLDYAMRGMAYDPQAARRNAERRMILDALG
jgi:hypothetical protein